MKKTLLSILATIAVIGSASAVPSPADRKALCEKHPDEYVWVEKTEACVPVNPCTPGVNEQIRQTYCLTPDALYYLPVDDDLRVRIINRYLANVLDTVIDLDEIKKLPNNGYMDAYGFKTIHGGYFAAEILDTEKIDATFCVEWAANAYGYNRLAIDGQMRINNIKVGDPVCKDIADFASLLCGETGEVITPDSDVDICSFHQATFKD